MGYYEALEDGIKRGTDSFGMPVYCPKCCICGNEVMSLSYTHGKKYYCMRCRNRKQDTRSSYTVPMQDTMQSH